MSQRIDNIYRAVTVPVIYKTVQLALGADRSRRRYVDDVLRPEAGMRFLDVGCGPATIFPYLPSVDYMGVDLNPAHIAHAKAAYGNRGKFICGDVRQSIGIDEGLYDIVNMAGLLHHLDDEIARRLLADCAAYTKPGGRIVTLDNVRLPKQRLVARTLNALDSGLRIRTPEAYARLTDGLKVDLETLLQHDALRVPYDHFIMIMHKR